MSNDNLHKNGKIHSNQTLSFWLSFKKFRFVNFQLLIPNGATDGAQNLKRDSQKKVR